MHWFHSRNVGCTDDIVAGKFSFYIKSRFRLVERNGSDQLKRKNKQVPPCSFSRPNNPTQAAQEDTPGSPQFGATSARAVSSCQGPAGGTHDGGGPAGGLAG